MDTDVPTFTIEQFLQSTTIKRERFPSYVNFLDAWGLDESNISLLTEERLKSFAVDYKGNLENKDFVLVPADAAAIAEVAKNFGEKGKRQKLTLGDIIDEIYKQRPDWKCILDKPETPPIDVSLPWVGRKAELDKLEKWAEWNISNHVRQTTTKQVYTFALIHGALGVGKTRTAVHASREIEQNLKKNNPVFALPDGSGAKVAFNEFFGHGGHICIDLYRGDMYQKDLEHDLGVSTSIGLRLAAHFFFGVGLNLLFTEVKDLEWRKQFTFEDVTSLISSRYAKLSSKDLLLTLQLDEFQHIPKEVLNGMLSTLATHITTEHKLKLCILVQLSGTDIDTGIKAIHSSKIATDPFLLSPLAEGEEVQILATKLKGTQHEHFLDNPLFLQAMDSLGRIPRYIEFFLVVLDSTPPKKDIAEFLRDVLDSVIGAISRGYGTAAWDKLLGGSRVGVRTMLLWALSKQHVSLNDKLNGITVEQARSTGVLLLEEVKDSPEEKYTLNVPLILLRAINRTIKDVSDEYLDPVRTFDDREFEKAMSGLRMLRQNMLVHIGRKTATYRELYPHVVGYEDDLDQSIPLKVLEEVWADGNPAKHESIHDYVMTKVPVLNCKESTLDLTKGSLLVHNVSMAPSSDALIVHPPDHIEGIQYKSSSDITRGKSSASELLLGRKTDSYKGPNKKKTIWAEFKKVTNTTHKKFYSALGKPMFNLFVVSNKPLETYDTITKAVEANDYTNGLPKGVAVVCYENFPAYAGSFAHRGLYLDLNKRKKETDSEDEGEHAKKAKLEED